MTNTDKKTHSRANVISVLYREEIDSSSRLSYELSSFLTHYQALQHAMWAGNDTFFRDNLQSLINLLPQQDLQDILSLAIFMIITAFEAAIAEQITHFRISPRSLDSLLSSCPEALQESLQRVYDRFMSIRQVEANQVATGISGTQDQSRNENFIWSQEASIDQIANYIREDEDLGTRRLISARIVSKQSEDDYIYGTIQHEKENINIRLASERKNYESLRSYVGQIIKRLRGSAKEEIEWRDEFFREGEQEFPVGCSWDKYPYPHVGLQLPGITTWVALDGRAEIIVRK